MRTILRWVAAAFLFTSPTIAQIQLRSTPPPFVVADLEPWFVDGRPITHAGNVYFQAGPMIHFNGNEMVRPSTETPKKTRRTPAPTIKTALSKDPNSPAKSAPNPSRSSATPT